jgi:NAD(P)-dependent dehydrogenase (short-subunit alcohol dehydrogenase family)
VVVNYARSRERAEAMREELGEDRCLPVQADIGRLHEVERLWRDAVRWKGRVDVLVNNASIREPVSLEAPAAEWDEMWIRTLRVNLIATAHLSRNAILHYREHGGGIIVGITARIAVRGDRPTEYHDGASKGGMNSLLRGIARFHAHENVLTYLVSGGAIMTDQLRAHLDRHGWDEVLKEIPLGEFGTPQDVADLVVFLASGRARHATGATIDVNGASYVR